MKAILEFNLPEDRDDFTLAQRGPDYFSFLWDLDQDLRSWQKYGHEFKSVNEVIEHIRDNLHKEINLFEVR